MAPYLTLYAEDAAQWRYPLAPHLRCAALPDAHGCGWCYLPHELPLWETIYQQWMRWLDNRCFDAMSADLRELPRLAQGRQSETTAVIIDSRTLQSTPESGARVGYDGVKQRKGSKVHVAVDTLSYLFIGGLYPPRKRTGPSTGIRAVRPGASRNGRQLLGRGYTSEPSKQVAEAHGILLQVVKRPQGSKGFVLLPRRWMVERRLCWLARFRRLARVYERLAVSFKQLHFVSAVILMLAKAVKPMTNA